MIRAVFAGHGRAAVPIRARSVPVLVFGAGLDECSWQNLHNVAPKPIVLLQKLTLSPEETLKSCHVTNKSNLTFTVSVYRNTRYIPELESQNSTVALNASQSARGATHQLQQFEDARTAGEEAGVDHEGGALVVGRGHRPLHGDGVRHDRRSQRSPAGQTRSQRSVDGHRGHSGHLLDGQTGGQRSIEGHSSEVKDVTQPVQIRQAAKGQ